MDDVEVRILLDDIVVVPFHSGYDFAILPDD